MEKDKCLRCGHTWYRRTPEKPVLCPSCKSKYWDEAREIKPKTKVKIDG